MSNLINAEEAVFSIDDLRGYIFSFLRKEPRVKCRECHDVCIWENYENYLYWLVNWKNIIF